MSSNTSIDSLLLPLTACTCATVHIFRCDICVQEHLAAGQGSVTQRRTVEDVQWALEQPEPASITAAAAATATAGETIADEQLYRGSSSVSSGCYALSKQWEKEFKAFSNKVSL
jgi:hypothetical protein